jgi:transcriptional regulator with XRE-family HTH domain
MRPTGSALGGIQLEAQLQALRQQRGLSQARAARLAGVSRPYLARIEAGRTASIGLKTLIRVVNGLGGRLRIGVEARPPASRAARRRQAAVPAAELFAPFGRSVPPAR